MKFIFIYGPPAVGKLTVANELAKITGFKVFHNHHTFDIAHEMLGFGDKMFDLSSQLRMVVFKAVAKENISIIFTMCYAKKYDDKWIKKVFDIIEQNKGKVCPVQLITDKNTLYTRVKAASRKKFRKLKHIKHLDSLMRKHDLMSEIPRRKSLKINNTKISPKKAAQMIKKHYKL